MTYAKYDVLNPRQSTDPRHDYCLDAWFGERKAQTHAHTANLSCRGLFLITRKPLAKGRTLKISLQLGEYKIPLVGKVAWARPSGTRGRPAGMEIQLNGSPGVYRRYVRELEEKAEEQGV